MQFFNIQITSQLSGVASATIRAWEKRYKAVTPQRDKNGHRLYSEKDIEKLTLLFQITKLGQSIGSIAHLEHHELIAFSESVQKNPKTKDISVTEELDLDKILSGLYLALTHYKLDIISHELEKAKAILGPRDFCLKLIIPLFHQIGLKVEKNELSVAQEHILSAITTFHMGQLVSQHYLQTQLRSPLVIIATPQGEMHEIGILAASLLLVHYKIRFIYLGANLPAESIAQAINSLSPNAILLGCTKGHELDHNVTILDFVDELKEQISPKTQVWIGGNLKSYLKNDLHKKLIEFFPSLETLDAFLGKL